MSRTKTLRRFGTTFALVIAVAAGLAGCVLVPYGDGPRGYGGDHADHGHHGYAHHDDER